MNRKHRVLTIVIVVILVVMMVLPLVLEMAMAADDTAGAKKSAAAAEAQTGDSSGCLDGIYIDTINVGGMRQNEVEEAIQTRTEQLSDDIIYFYAGDKYAAVRAEDLGLTCTNAEKTAEQAVRIGKAGNIYRKFQIHRFLENHQIILDLNYEIEAVKAESELKKVREELQTDPLPERLVPDEEGKPVVKDAEEGISVDVSGSISDIVQYMENDWHGGTGGVTLATDSIKPDVTDADLSQFTDNLGEGTAAVSGDGDQQENLRSAAEQLSGTIVAAGETFRLTLTESTDTGDDAEEDTADAADIAADGSSETDAEDTGINAEIRQTAGEALQKAVSAAGMLSAGNTSTGSAGQELTFTNTSASPVYIYAEAGMTEFRICLFGTKS